MEKDMKDVLDQLAEINSASAKIMRNTNHEKVAYADYIKEKKSDYDSKIKSQIDKEVEDLRVKIIAENSAILEESHKDLDKNLSALDESYQKNRETWINDIFKSIIKE